MSIRLTVKTIDIDKMMLIMEEEEGDDDEVLAIVINETALLCKQ